MLITAATPVLANQADALMYLDRAEDYLDQGDRRAALIELKNAVREAPDNASIRKRLGLLQLQLGDPQAAAKELQRVYDMGRGDADLIAALSAALVATGQRDRALALFDSLQPGTPAEWAARADLRLKNGDLDGAAADYKQALALRPDWAVALIGTARVTKQQDGADEAIPWVGRAIAADPRSADGWELLGDLEAAGTRSNKALSAYREALRLRLASGGGTAAEAVMLRLKMATVLLGLDRSAEAAEQLDEVRASQPDNPLLQSLSAMLALQTGDTIGARDGLLQIVSRYPNYYPALLYLGKVHLALGEYQQAVEVLRRFTSAQPDSVEGVSLYGRALALGGSGDQALTVLQPLALRFPNAIEVLDSQRIALEAVGNHQQAKAVAARYQAALNAREQMKAAVTQIAAGEGRPALDTLEKIATDYPSLPQPQLLRYRELIRQRNFDSAVQVAQALEKQLPNSALPALLLGIAETGRADLEAAQAAFELAWKRAPGAPGVAERLAILALARRQPERAEDYYREVLEHHPGDSKTLTRLAMLAGRRGDAAQRLAYLEQNLRYHPLDWQARVRLVKHLHTAGQTAAAIKALKAVEGPKAGDPTYLALLVLLQLEHVPEDAVDNARKLLTLQPGAAQAQLLLALAEAQSDPEAFGRYRLLQRIFAQGQRGDLATVALSRKDIDGTLTAAREMQAKYPDNASWVEIEAKMLRDRGDQQAATALMADWSREHPDNASSDMVAAGAALAASDNAAAINSYREALRKDPDNVGALNNLAWLTRNSDPAAALGYARRAAERSNNPEVLDTLGVILMANNKPEPAVRVLRQAVMRSPGSLAKQYHLAQALAAAGDQRTARQLLQRVLKSGKTFEERAEAQALLNSLDAYAGG